MRSNNIMVPDCMLYDEVTEKHIKEENELIIGFRNKDEKALNDLIDICLVTVRRALKSLQCHLAYFDDIEQEAMTALFRRFCDEGFVIKRSLVSYIFKTTEGYFYNYMNNVREDENNTSYGSFGYGNEYSGIEKGAYSETLKLDFYSLEEDVVSCDNYNTLCSIIQGMDNCTDIEVAFQLAAGKTHKEISEKLGICIRTVNNAKERVEKYLLKSKTFQKTYPEIYGKYSFRLIKYRAKSR